MTRKNKPPEQLPPGHYNMQVTRVRKVRNKDRYRIFMDIESGPCVSMTIRIPKEEDHG